MLGRKLNTFFFSFWKALTSDHLKKSREVFIWIQIQFLKFEGESEGVRISAQCLAFTVTVQRELEPFKTDFDLKTKHETLCGSLNLCADAIFYSIALF